MRSLRVPTTAALVAASLIGLSLASSAQNQRRQLTVVSTQPSAISSAPITTSVTVVFDRPVKLSSFDRASFRVFGRYSGAAKGNYRLSHGGYGVTFVPSSGSFSAGEVVWVNLSHDITGVDLSRLRAAGYAFQFGTQVSVSSGTFRRYGVMSNRSGSETHLYGASATDLNGDRFLDLTTVNEESADLRVFLNRADGSGFYQPFLAPEPIGHDGSPNEPGDFDNDGKADLCIDARESESVWVVLGNGDGTFAKPQEIPVGHEPHGIATLDVDGDADLVIVNCNRGTGNLSLLLNDGAGVFGAPTFFDGGVSGEYGLAAGDMNRDGITDLVVAGQAGSQLRTLLGNGNGTFTPAGPAQASGGQTWVVTLGDVDGDGDLDATTANSTTGTGGRLLGNGDGTFGEPATVDLGAETTSTDLGDLDGDGDLDWVLSCFGGGFWLVYRNDGSGTFAFWRQINAPRNPSCSILLDTDNDGDLDMALTDELADVIVLMRNS